MAEEPMKEQLNMPNLCIDTIVLFRICWSRQNKECYSYFCNTMKDIYKGDTRFRQMPIVGWKMEQYRDCYDARLHTQKNKSSLAKIGGK